MPTAATRTTDVIARPSPAQADAWAATVVAAVTRPYPWAAQHTVTGPDDVDVTPTRLHPAFHGSYDWHSCVHMLWSGLTLLGLPGEPLDADAAAALSALLDERLTPDNVAAEAALLARTVRKARKGPINDRIRFMCRMMAGERYHLLDTCAHTRQALCEAVWDGRDPTADVRLDNGTTNIDSLDALEYSFEPYMEQMTALL